MASSTEGTNFRNASIGRGFASLDPERQGEVPGRMIRTTDGWSPMRVRPARTDWTRLQPDREITMFEGSSSRRSP